MGQGHLWFPMLEVLPNETIKIRSCVLIRKIQGYTEEKPCQDTAPGEAQPCQGSSWAGDVCLKLMIPRILSLAVQVQQSSKRNQTCQHLDLRHYSLEL